MPDPGWEEYLGLLLPETPIGDAGVNLKNNLKALANIVAGKGLCLGRLTPTSGEPYPGDDEGTGFSTIYFTPLNGDLISLYNTTESLWETIQFSEESISTSGGTASTAHDVFAYNNNGSISLELLGWSNDSTRASELSRQNGILVKNGDASRRYLGSVRLDASNEFEFSESRKQLYNSYNKRFYKVWRYDASSVSEYNATSEFRNRGDASADVWSVSMMLGELENVQFVASGRLDTTSSLGTCLMRIGGLSDNPSASLVAETDTKDFGGGISAWEEIIGYTNNDYQWKFRAGNWTPKYNDVYICMGAMI